MNTSYRYKKIDAFTAEGSLGNPAACLYLSPEQQLDEDEMLQIAQQHKDFVSEMVYCTMHNDSIHLTYYSPVCEVDFCGHGTIACMHGLIKETHELLSKKEILIQTNRKGFLTVYNNIPEQDTVLVSAPDPIYIGAQVDSSLIADRLNIPPTKISGAYPIDMIDAGLRTLIVPIKNLETEISLLPDQELLRMFCIEHDIDIVLVFSIETKDPRNIAHTRVFTPKFGYIEDPATGSGNSAFGFYMLEAGLWDGSPCTIEQGGSDRIFNRIHLSYENGKVLFGGSATLRIDGVYYL